MENNTLGNWDMTIGIVDEPILGQNQDWLEESFVSSPDTDTSTEASNDTSRPCFDVSFWAQLSDWDDRAYKQTHTKWASPSN